MNAAKDGKQFQSLDSHRSDDDPTCWGFQVTEEEAKAQGHPRQGQVRESGPGSETLKTDTDLLLKNLRTPEHRASGAVAPNTLFPGRARIGGGGGAASLNLLLFAERENQHWIRKKN